MNVVNPCIYAVLAALTLATPALAQPADMAGMDTNKDGRTSRVEYRIGLVSETMKYDKNRDGRVMVSELPGVLRLPGIKGAVQKVFRSNDTSGDGALSPDELTARAEVRFGELDNNKDGYLDAAEIKAGKRGGGR